MSDVQEYAARLAQVIGPRPAGTEEEQQASFFIDEVFREAGLEVRTEEFRCNLNYKMPRVICCLFTVVLGFLSIFLNMIVLPALLICLITAVLFALDCFELSPFSKFGQKGLSQNIVARYEPPVQNAAGAGAGAAMGASGGRAPRRRKVILVANYDSGKVRRELKAPVLGVLNIIRWVELGAMVLVPLALLIRLFSGENAGPLVIFTDVLTVIGVVGALLVLISFITQQAAAYNDGANNNAAGVAVMLDVAKRISEARDAAPQNAVIHGAREAYAAGVVPPGAELVYAEGEEGEYSADSEGDASGEGVSLADPADTLGIAEAHVALAGGAGAVEGAAANISGNQMNIPSLSQEGDISAFINNGENTLAADAATGLPTTAAEPSAVEVVEAVETVETPVDLSQSESQGLEVAYAERTAEAQATLEERPAAYAVGSTEAAASFFTPASKEPSVPDWYKRAMSKANKSESAVALDPSKRSKFSDALDAAAAASRPEPEPANPSGLSSDAERRLQAMRESIMAGRPLSEATGTVGDAAEIADAIENDEAGQVAVEAESIAAEPASSHLQGIDGHLSNATAASNYEAEQSEGEGAASRKKANSKVAAGASAGTAGTGADKKRQGKRIISTDAQPAVPSDAVQKEPRKKRSIMLPSLTGALKAVSADDATEEKTAKAKTSSADAASRTTQAESDAEVARIAARNANKLKKANLAVSLPSLDKNANAAEADMAGATGSLEPITQEEQVAVAKSSTAAATRTKKSSGEEAQLLEAEGAQTKHRVRAQAVRDTADPASTISISQVGSFANAGMTGAFEPLGSDFVADMSAEDIYIDDADDSGYEENFTEHGALAGPGYVEMPKSRRERVFGKLRRKNKRQDDISFSEAVGIEDGYDARQVGKDRGGWESFRQSGKGSARNQANDAWADDDYWNGGAYNVYGDSHISSLREDIREFHEGPVQLEVWFVALGAELADNAGMKSFIAEHGNDLRGAMIVDLDALGAGELTMIEREGTYRPASMSSRMKRYVHKAGEALGIRVGATTMLWDRSAAYVAERHGCQTLHLAGVKDGKPAYLGESSDSMSNIDPQLMEENAAFVMEFIRGI